MISAIELALSMSNGTAQTTGSPSLALPNGAFNFLELCAMQLATTPNLQSSASVASGNEAASGVPALTGKWNAQTSPNQKASTRNLVGAVVNSSFLPFPSAAAPTSAHDALTLSPPQAVTSSIGDNNTGPLSPKTEVTSSVDAIPLIPTDTNSPQSHDSPTEGMWASSPSFFWSGTELSATESALANTEPIEALLRAESADATPVQENNPQARSADVPKTFSLLTNSAVGQSFVSNLACACSAISQGVTGDQSAQAVVPTLGTAESPGFTTNAALDSSDSPEESFDSRMESSTAKDVVKNSSITTDSAVQPTPANRVDSAAMDSANPPHADPRPPTQQSMPEPHVTMISKPNPAEQKPAAVAGRDFVVHAAPREVSTISPKEQAENIPSVESLLPFSPRVSTSKVCGGVPAFSSQSGAIAGQNPLNATPVSTNDTRSQAAFVAAAPTQSSPPGKDSQPDTARDNSSDTPQHKDAIPGLTPIVAVSQPSGMVLSTVSDPTIQVAPQALTAPNSPPKQNAHASLPDPGSTLPPESRPAAPPAGPVQVAQMISKAAQSEMRIGMNTSAFGSVEVRTVIRANDVGIQIGSEKGDLHSLLSNDIPGIANSLQQQNLRLTQVSFHQPGLVFSNDSGRQGNSQPRAFAPRPNSSATSAVEVGMPEPTPCAEAVETMQGLSILA